MDERKVFVVMGSTGEYSDRREWGVRAFFEQPAAEDFAFKATARALEIKQSEWFSQRHFYPRPEMPKSQFDPDLTDMDYTGADYFVVEVPLAE